MTRGLVALALLVGLACDGQTIKDCRYACGPNPVVRATPTECTCAVPGVAGDANLR